MGARDLYAVELSKSANQLIAEGNNDPSADEILDHYLDGKIIGGAAIQEVRAKLSRIRDLLERDFGIDTHLVSDTYYNNFRRQLPLTEDEATRCLPTGRGVKAAGIRYQIDQNDPILRAKLRLELNQGAGKLKRGMDRTVESFCEGHLDKDAAKELATGAHRRMMPENMPGYQSMVLPGMEGVKTGGGETEEE
jgi:hypothetical protein